MFDLSWTKSITQLQDSQQLVADQPTKSLNARFFFFFLIHGLTGPPASNVSKLVLVKK